MFVTTQAPSRPTLKSPCLCYLRLLSISVHFGPQLQGEGESTPTLCNNQELPFVFPIVTCPGVAPERHCSGVMLMVPRSVSCPYCSHIAAPPTPRSLVYKGCHCTCWLFPPSPHLLQLPEFFLATKLPKGRCAGRWGECSGCGPGTLRAMGRTLSQG